MMIDSPQTSRILNMKELFFFEISGNVGCVTRGHSPEEPSLEDCGLKTSQ